MSEDASSSGDAIERTPCDSCGTTDESALEGPTGTTKLLCSDCRDEFENHEENSTNVEFDCPECEHTSEHWTALTGSFTVFWHFFWSHGSLSFRAGSPFHNEDGPEFEGGAR